MISERREMAKIHVKVKAPFGEVALEGESFQEILDLINSIPPDFVTVLSGTLSTKLAPTVKTQLEGIIEFTTEGPILITRRKLTHYEAIGLILYALEEKKGTAARISKLTEASGIRCQVPARLNEMAKRGLVFKPNPSRPEWKLTAQGERWVKEKVLAKLRGEGG